MALNRNKQTGQMRYVNIIKLDGIFGNNILETVLKIQRHPGENRRNENQKTQGKTLCMVRMTFGFSYRNC